MFEYYRFTSTPFNSANWKQYSTAPQQSRTPTPRFAAYRQALSALSERTRTPLPSLVASFAVLHELTATIPLAGFFLFARTFDVGNRLLEAFPERDDGSDEVSEDVASSEVDWKLARRREWTNEGKQWAERVGTRYGLFGFEKGSGQDAGRNVWGTWVSERAAGDFVNAVVAYTLTKVLLPVRIGVSLYFSPSFSRRVIEPSRLMVMRVFRRKPPPPPGI